MVCSACHRLVADLDTDYFTLLGLERTYDVDGAVLRKAYLRVSRETHPDRFDASDADEAMQLNARLNEANRVLKDPVLRAEYLLELSGGQSSAENREVPQEILTYTLMTREEIEEAHAANDAGALARIRDQATARHDGTAAEIGALARRLPGDATLRGQLRDALNAMKYHQRILAALDGTDE